MTWELLDEIDQVYSEAKSEAWGIWQKEDAIYRWAALRGEIYVPVTETMQLVVGQNVHAVFTSKVAGTIPHTFKDPDALAEEIIDARVYGGMHYRNSVVTGVRLGRMTAEWVGDHYFKRVRKGGGR